MKKKYRCGCGAITGEQCNWSGPLRDMVVVEFIPECIRESHVAAGNIGTYHHNGSVRLAVESQCGSLIVEWGDCGDHQWAEIINADPSDYARPD